MLKCSRTLSCSPWQTVWNIFWILTRQHQKCCHWQCFSSILSFISSGNWVNKSFWNADLSHPFLCWLLLCLFRSVGVTFSRSYKDRWDRRFNSYLRWRCQIQARALRPGPLDMCMSSRAFFLMGKRISIANTHLLETSPGVAISKAHISIWSEGLLWPWCSSSMTASLGRNAQAQMEVCK